MRANRRRARRYFHDTGNGAVGSPVRRVLLFQLRTPMKSGTRDQVEGTAKDLKGAAKQAIGKATGNPRQQLEGTVERTTGKFQKKTGEIKRDLTRD